MGPGKAPGIIRGGHSKNGNRSLPDRPKFPGIRAFINPFRGTASRFFSPASAKHRRRKKKRAFRPANPFMPFR